MATWPSGNKAVTSTTDADSDSISGARVDINKTVSNLNDVIDMFDMSTLADDRILVYDSASATFKVEDNVSGFTGDLDGNPLYDSTGDVVVEDKMIVKANSTDDRNISLGDETFGSPNYLLTNLKIDGKEERWAWITLDEHSDGAFPKTIAGGNFTNPLIISRIQGGTPGNEVGLPANKRIFGLQATVGYDDDGAGTNYVLPTSASFRFQAEVTENQRTTARGSKVYFDTIANGSTSTTRGLQVQGDTVTITPLGAGKIDCGGDLTIDSGGDLTIQANGGTNDIIIDSPINSTGDITIQANSGTDDVIITRPRVNVYSTSATGGTYTPDYNDGEWQIWEATGGSSFNFNLPSNLASGQEMKITVYNNSGGNFNLTVNSSYLESFSVLTISDTFRSAIVIENHGGLYYASVIIHNQ